MIKPVTVRADMIIPSMMSHPRHLTLHTSRVFLYRGGCTISMGSANRDNSHPLDQTPDRPRNNAYDIKT